MVNESDSLDPTSEELFTDMLIREVERSRQVYPRPFASRHEAYGCIAEEFKEFFEAIRWKLSDGFLLEELVQMAAMCARAAADLRFVTSVAETRREQSGAESG